MFKAKKTFFLIFLLIFFGASSSYDKVYVSPDIYKATDKDLEVVFLDVGQGDSILIRTPNKKNILLDGGGDFEKANMKLDAGKDVVIPYLKNNGIEKIDAIIVSHSHPDHVGGLRFVLKNIEVNKIYETGIDSGYPEYKEFTDIAEQKGIKRNIIFENDFVEIDPSIKIEILWPPKDASFREFNDNSLVFKLSYKKVSLLFPGDVQVEAENELSKKYGQKLHANALKSPHHGSYFSSTESFVENVMPEIVVISCGLVNEFNHPHTTVLTRYKRIKAMIFRTDYNSDIKLYSNGDKITVKVVKK